MSIVSLIRNRPSVPILGTSKIGLTVHEPFTSTHTGRISFMPAASESGVKSIRKRM
jgi:hypothetical protein